MKKNVKKCRVYICHTYYHVYVATVKELVKRKDENSKADIILSTMSNNFENLSSRLTASGVFNQVFMYDEKEDVTDDEVMSFHQDKGNIISNLIQRITYTRLLGKLQEPFIPTDLSTYQDIYVFCDSDPIGYYLNYKKIRYHAVEDGLNTGKLDDQARYSNRGAWPLKLFMSKLGLIFIENGYSRYCIDYEVNDISVNHNPPPNAIEVSRKQLNDKLSKEDHAILVDIFLENKDAVISKLIGSKDDAPNHEKKSNVLILTEPLCELDVRKKIFGDIIDQYKDTNRVVIKPHPRDLLDYQESFPDAVVVRERFPMEVLGDIEGFEVDKVISVVTQVDNIFFAKEIIYLGFDFLDKYEDPSIHRRIENLN